MEGRSPAAAGRPYNEFSMHGIESILAQHAGMHSMPAPVSPVEYVLVAIAVVTAAYALVAAVRMTFRPGETEPNHIKRVILDDDAGPGEPLVGQRRTQAR